MLLPEWLKPNREKVIAQGLKRSFPKSPSLNMNEFLEVRLMLISAITETTTPKTPTTFAQYFFCSSWTIFVNRFSRESECSPSRSIVSLKTSGKKRVCSRDRTLGMTKSPIFNVFLKGPFSIGSLHSHDSPTFCGNWLYSSKIMKENNYWGGMLIWLDAIGI